jgi:hypothetical protein
MSGGGISKDVSGRRPGAGTGHARRKGKVMNTYLNPRSDV